MCDQPVLVSAAMDGTIRFWDTASQKNTLALQYKESQVNTLCITPDGTQLAVGAWQNLRMYSLKEPTSNGLHTFSVHEQKNVTAVGFQADGKWMFTGGEDGTAKIWDMRVSTTSTQLLCQRVFQVNTPIHSVVLHPNQVELIVADSTGALYVWDLRTDKDDSLVTEVDLAEHILHVDIDKAGRQCAAVTNRGHLFLWNVSHTGMIPHTQPNILSTSMGSAEDKENVAESSSLLPPIAPAPPPAPELAGMVVAVPRAHMEQSLSPAYLGGGSISGGSLMSGSVAQRPCVKIAAHSTFAVKCRFRPDGLAVASTSADESCKVWSVTNHKLLNSYCVPKSKWVWDCAFTNDSNYMITATSDGLLRMWDLKNNEVVRTYQGHSLGITAMAFRDCA